MLATWHTSSQQWRLIAGKFSSIFSNSSVIYLFRCLIPGCDENSTSYGAEYVNFAIPHDSLGKHKKCERFLRRNKTNGLFSCSADVFDRNETSLCDEFVFENEEVSIAKEVIFSKKLRKISCEYFFSSTIYYVKMTYGLLVWLAL